MLDCIKSYLSSCVRELCQVTDGFCVHPISHVIFIYDSQPITSLNDVGSKYNVECHPMTAVFNNGVTLLICSIN